MTLTTRTILILALMLSLTGGLAAQETSTAGTATTGAAAATETTEKTGAAATDTAAAAEKSAEGTEPRSVSAYEVRNQFVSIVQSHPYELSMILKLDPSLLNNEAFVSGYPEVAKFLEKHPEIRSNPRFYLATFPTPGHNENPVEEVFEALAVMFAFALTAFVLGWAIRTIIEQKRWSRLSKQQSEVHNKILDRFSTSQEVLDYIKTPAGTKFLESAPIPVYSQKPTRFAPQSRLMWSIQAGVVVAIGGLGMLLVSLRFDNGEGDGLFTLGAIALAIGVGFIASAIVSLALSRRLGLLAEDAPLDDAGLVR